MSVCEQYLKKGSKVFVEGKLQTRKWQDQSGNDRYSTEVVLQGYGGTLLMLDGAQGGSKCREAAYSPADGGFENPRGGYDDLDDDIPF